MRNTILSLMLAVPLIAFAGDIPMKPGEVVHLKDGGTLSIKKNGEMVHLDAAGKRVQMRDNVVMEGKDGMTYVMKNDAIWKTLSEKGTLNPKF